MDTPNLQPCARCRKRKVVKPGDYCVSCAAQWEPLVGDSYFVVNPDSASDIHEVSGLAIRYLLSKQERAFERCCKYVVYYSKGEWKDITIDDGFHLPSIMNRLLKRES